MKYRVRLLIILLFTALFVASCTPPPPPQDPTKEQITLLQKQLLELQKVQNDTKQKLDESVATIESLSARLKELEERRRATPAPPQIGPKPEETSTVESEQKPPQPAKKKPAKKPVKKKKQAPRRQ